MKQKSHQASIFIRNSGTEDKIGVSLRGRVANRERLLNLGEEAVRILFMRMKNQNKQVVKAQSELLRLTKKNGAPALPPDGLSQDEYERLLYDTSVKEGLIDKPFPGARLTRRGEWLLKAQAKSK